jgi:hypothetical protein
MTFDAPCSPLGSLESAGKDQALVILPERIQLVQTRILCGVFPTTTLTR